MDEPSFALPAAPPPPRVSPRRRPLIDLFPPAVRRETEPPPPEQTSAVFYGLQERPFSLEPDPRFLYHSAGHDRVLDGILRAIRDRGGIVVVTGETGIGKTILCRTLGELLDQHTLISVVTDASGSAEEFLAKLLVDFGVITKEEVARGATRQATPHSLTERLRTFLLSLGPLQASAVVVIDDAHNLPADAIERLSVLAALEDVGSLLHIVLVGQQSIRSLLRRAEADAIDRRVIVDVQLDPLAEEEIAGYIGHRLAVAGSSPRVEFDEGALHAVFVLTHGVPRLVNLLCDRALTRGGESAASTIDRYCIARAAADLDMTVGSDPAVATPATRVGPLAVGLVVVLLAAAGALLSAWVFQERLGSAVAVWEQVPSPPTAPLMRQAVPLGPLPVPE